MRLEAFATLLAMTGLTAGCSGLTQVQDAISKFDQGAHGVASAEVGYLKAVRAVDCQSQYIVSAKDYAVGYGGIDLTGQSCKQRVVTDAQMQIRQKLLDAITLYADQLAAIASADDNKTLGTNAQSLASNLNSFAKQRGFTTSGMGAIVEAAVIALSQAVVDQIKFSSIRDAARKQHDSLVAVVNALKQENADFAASVTSNFLNIQAAMKAAADAARKQTGASVFFMIQNTPANFQGANAFSAPLQTGAGATTPTEPPNPDSIAAQINQSLDALVAANKAIADAGTGGIVAAVNDLVARVQAAQAIQAALSK